MGAQSVGYLEAWEYWWRGVDVKPMSLHGFPMIWVGRIAKIMTFAAGLTVILDLAGPDRVARFIKQEQSKERGYFWVREVGGCGWALMVLLGGGLAFFRAPAPWVVLATIPGFLLMLYSMVAPIVWTFASTGLQNERRQRKLRWISIASIGIAFTFDLLTS